MPRRIETTSTPAGKPQGGFLDGQLLIAMPTMDDPRFAGTLVYLCAHSEDGAMGIVINREAGRVNFPELLAQLNVLPADARIELAPAMQNFKVLRGGPVETRRGFVLHSSDYHTEDSTLAIDDTVSLTATVDILKAIATGEGPRQALLALGYAGWGPGQLETEIQGNGWLHCAADPDLVFAANIEAKYAKALGKLGIAPGQLSPEAGHA